MKPRARFKTAIRVIAAASLAAFLAASGLHTWYGLRLPDRPDPPTGRVYALNYHGSHVYLTAAERCILVGLFATAILGGLIVVALRVSREGLRYGE